MQQDKERRIYLAALFDRVAQIKVKRIKGRNPHLEISFLGLDDPTVSYLGSLINARVRGCSPKRDLVFSGVHTGPLIAAVRPYLRRRSEFADPVSQFARTYMRIGQRSQLSVTAKKERHSAAQKIERLQKRERESSNTAQPPTSAPSSAVACSPE